MTGISAGDAMYFKMRYGRGVGLGNLYSTLSPTKVLVCRD